MQCFILVYFINFAKSDFLETHTLSDGRYIEYIQPPDKLSHALADEYCAGQNGYFPIPKTFEENKFLTSMGDTWLGFTVDDQSNVNYFNWHSGQPKSGKDAVYIEAEDAHETNWKTEEFHAEKDFICYLGEYTVPVKGLLIETIAQMNRAWRVLIELKVPSPFEEGANMIHLTAGDDEGSFGDRFLFIFLDKVSDSVQLRIHMDMNNVMNMDIATIVG